MTVMYIPTLFLKILFSKNDGRLLLKTFPFENYHALPNGNV